jgi:N-methylhydantoinase A/oxoprolinase/acetone carboxylase beta subunit
LGFDVGGTFTDGVLMKDEVVLAKAKSLTTEDVTTGIIDMLDMLLTRVAVDQGSLY